MHLFHKCPDYFEALCCYPMHPCVQPGLIQQQLPFAQPALRPSYYAPQLQQQPLAQPAISPSYYAPSPISKG